ncbi:MAG: pro-sigmaK processing inhibitor BofA family protein [Bacilli bacterium]|nr:pro-sigmaK processing inhibitor BofA family protein [Bacilli bacterium]
MMVIQKLIYKVLKRIICAFLIINCFNFICGSFLIFIPINIISIFLIVVFGIPGIISINLIYFLI